tara:strand:+ start:348 stop:647 length:300 start_codon:yes stop_codon:yes gene_type:complete
MSRKLNYDFYFWGNGKPLLVVLASNQNFPAKTTETSRTFEMDDRNNIPPHLFEDMSDEMIEIYLSQARQEQHEDEEYREWERIWHERHNEEYENARSDL